VLVCGVLQVDIHKRLGAFDPHARFDAGGETLGLFGPPAPARA
jgi:hypothetical protein